MKRKKLILFAILLLGLGPTGLKAQNQLNVKEKAGKVTSFALSGIQKLTFPSGNMEVKKTDGSSASFALNDIRYLTFSPITTDAKSLDSKRESTFSLYPNPVTNEFQLSYESIEARTLNVEIIDLQGRVLLRQTINSQYGANHNRISVSQLQKGLYICRLQNGNKYETIKFLKN